MPPPRENFCREKCKKNCEGGIGGWKGSVKRRSSKNENTEKEVNSGALLVVAAVAAAGSTHQLATPPPSEYVDAESSVNISLPTNEGRHIKVTLAFDPSPTNAVQVAFGRDADADGDLAPEETEVRVGCDCGEWLGGGEGVFDLKCPKLSWNLAKVTTHNVAATNVAVFAKFYNTGFRLILR